MSRPREDRYPCRDLAPTVAVDADRDDHGDRDDTAVLAHLHVGRVDPQIPATSSSIGRWAANPIVIVDGSTLRRSPERCSNLPLWTAMPGTGIDLLAQVIFAYDSFNFDRNRIRQAT
jgi:hypothetical protein